MGPHLVSYPQSFSLCLSFIQLCGLFLSPFSGALFAGASPTNIQGTGNPGTNAIDLALPWMQGTLR